MQRLKIVARVYEKTFPSSGLLTERRLIDGIPQDVWYKTNSQNWHRNIHPKLLMRFPQALPYPMLKDKREGDVVTLYTLAKDGQTIVELALTCNQLGYSHKEYGPFEDLLARIKELSHSHFSDGQ